MSLKKQIIQTGNSFHTAPPSSSSEQQQAVDYYFLRFEKAVELEETVPIFLDTNVLLRGYGVTPQRRALLYQFFEQYKDRIIISKLVDTEFSRNRAKVAKTYAHLPEAQLSDLDDQLANLLLDLETNSEKEETEPLELIDELSPIYDSFEKIDNLTIDEKQFLIKEFNFLKKELKRNKYNANNIFPGKGDLIEKPKYPYGDYILYHEMLQYISKEKTDAIFLTFDIAKGDWLKDYKDPHPHYIHKTFALTQKAIFVVDANYLFDKLFSTSFEAIVPTEKKGTSTAIPQSDLEKELIMHFNKLEKALRIIAKKSDIESSPDIPAKQVLDDLNFDDIISDPVYYELKGIWSVKEALSGDEIDLIRRQYTEQELTEILIVIKDSLRGIDKL